MDVQMVVQMVESQEKKQAVAKAASWVGQRVVWLGYSTAGLSVTQKVGWWVD